MKSRFEVSFVVPGKARGKQRPRATRQGRVYTPAETVNAEAYIKMLATQAMDGAAPMDGPLWMLVKVDVAVPASWSRKRTELALIGELMPTSKPDLDNIVKLYADALNGVVYLDDKQIIDLTVRKSFGAIERTSIYVEKVGTSHDDRTTEI